MHVVVAGHVDHGKSTVVGRLLADTGSLPEGRLAQVRDACARRGQPFEHAFLLDALADERAQGITIDAARIAFRSARREYQILDAPGHIEFLRNMVTGASHAEAALLVIDARQGVQENSRRHGYLLALLGIRQIAVLVNKMDLVGWDEAAFRRLVAEYDAFLRGLGVAASAFLPVSGAEGDNVVCRGPRLAWFEGPSVLGALDAFEEEPLPLDGPLRLPVQDVYKFARGGEDRRIVAGTVVSGRIAQGDAIVFYPSGKHSRVRALEAFGRPAPAAVGAGAPAAFTLAEQVYVTRGEVVARAAEPRPDVSTRLRASVFWLGRTPLRTETEYLLRLGTARTAMHVEQVERVLDAATLAEVPGRQEVRRHEVADVVLRTQRPVAFDGTDVLAATSRFVIVDDYDVRGGGIVRAALSDAQATLRAQVFRREDRWERGLVAAADRAARYGQRPGLLLVTGPPEGRRKEVAKAVERRLFLEGRGVYYLGFGSVRYGLDADLDRDRALAHEPELMRRLGEVAHILLDAGLILVVSAQALAPADLAVFRTTVEPERILVVWVGGEGPKGLDVDLDLGDGTGPDAEERVHALLARRGLLGPAGAPPSPPARGPGETY